MRFGLGWVGLVHIFVCNFQVRLDFFSFMKNISAVPDPSLGRVGSGRGFLGGLDRIYRVGWPVTRSSPTPLLKKTSLKSKEKDERKREKYEEKKRRNEWRYGEGRTKTP